MATYAITFNGQPYSLTTNDAAQIAGIAAARVLRNTSLPEDSDDRIEDDAAYLEFVFGHWAAANPGFTEPQLQSAFASAVASYAGQDIPEPAPEDISPEAAKAQLLAYAADKRFQVETDGIVVNSFAVATDRPTQNKLAQAVLAYQTGALTGAIDWKGPSAWISLDQATITGLASAVALHVQAAFTAERAVCEAIDVGTITTKAEIDAAEWPSN